MKLKSWQQHLKDMEKQTRYEERECLIAVFFIIIIVASLVSLYHAIVGA
jgi:ABC-type lipoprotein release transport system permease subunit